MKSLFRAFLSLFAFAVAACGLSAVGSFEPGEGGMLSAGDPGKPPQACTDACAFPSPPAGFSLVLLVDAGATCPPGFDATDVVSNPVVQPGACVCDPCTFAGADCNQGTLTASYDNTPGASSCNIPAPSYSTQGGACENVGGGSSSHGRVNAPANPTTGTCSSEVRAVKASVQRTARKLCAPQSGACIDAACGSKACFVADGDVACPGGTQKTSIGTDVDVACAACGCNVTSVTCGGTWTFYQQVGCAGAVVFALTSGACVATSGQGYASRRWAGSVLARQCALSAPAGSPIFVQPRTVCCP